MDSYYVLTRHFPGTGEMSFHCCGGCRRKRDWFGEKGRAQSLGEEGRGRGRNPPPSLAQGFSHSPCKVSLGRGFVILKLWDFVECGFESQLYQMKGLAEINYFMVLLRSFIPPTPMLLKILLLFCSSLNKIRLVILHFFGTTLK